MIPSPKLPYGVLHTSYKQEARQSNTGDLEVWFRRSKGFLHHRKISLPQIALKQTTRFLSAFSIWVGRGRAYGQ